MARRPRTPRHLVAASDCERCRTGIIAQPANTLTSLGYVAAGADLLRQPDPDRHYAWAVIAVGVGSVALHGPGGVAGKWLHDAALLAMLGLVVLSDATVAEGRPMPEPGVAVVVAGAGVLAHPRTSEYAQGALGAVAVVAEARRFLRQRNLREAAVRLPLTTAGATLHMLGRTDQPLCRPDSLLQAHAAWHLLSATSLWARRRF